MRRRKAALTGALLPHELLDRLAEASDPEPDLGLPAELSGIGNKAAPQTGNGGGKHPPARMTADGMNGIDSLSHGGAAAAFIAQHSTAQASVQAAAEPAAGAGQAPGAPAEPLPAYTSLARQHLQQRLKAAIAAGSRPAGATATRAQAPRPGTLPCRARDKAGCRQPPLLQQAQATGLTCSRGVSLGQAGSRAAPGLSGVQPVVGLGAAGTLPVPSACCLEDGFHLLPPGSSTSSGTLGPEQQQQPGAGTRQGHLPPSQANTAQPHWLAGQLLQQSLYAAAVELPGRPQRAQQRIQRGLLALRMPPLSEQFAGGLRLGATLLGIGLCRQPRLHGHKPQP